MLPPSIQVCPVEIPGRGRRSQEPGITDVLALAEQLASALPLQVCDMPLSHATVRLRHLCCMQTPQSALCPSHHARRPPCCLSDT